MALIPNGIACASVSLQATLTFVEGPEDPNQRGEGQQNGTTQRHSADDGIEGGGQLRMRGRKGRRER
eukprot:81512-Pyramimonas_sp.AAC.1